MKVYKQAINLIKDSIHVLNDKENLVNDPTLYNNIKNLFVQTFAFLKNFVINNTTNQYVMSEFIISVLVGMDKGDLRIDQIFHDLFYIKKRL